MADALAHLWPHMDVADNPLFADLFVRSWPDEAFECLHGLGLLDQAQCADIAACPSCPDGHQEEVISLEVADGSLRFFIYCPANLRVEVAADSLRQWTVNFDKLADLVANALAATGQVKPVVAGRVWRLGKVSWQSAKRDALFARGLHMADGPRIADQMRAQGRAIILVADRLPPGEIWKQRRPAVVPLSQVATLSDSGIEIDRVALVSMIAEADAAGVAAEANLMDRRQLKLIVRQQVKAEQKSDLKDDGMVKAYRAHGSSRKAAEALSKEGYEVHHSTIARAVLRAGGKKAVMRGESSSSVNRRVASQRRDKTKKITPRPQDEG